MPRPFIDWTLNYKRDECLLHWLDTLHVHVGTLGVVCIVGIGSIVGALGTALVMPCALGIVGIGIIHVHVGALGTALVMPCALGIVGIIHVGAGIEGIHTTWGR